MVVLTLALGGIVLGLVALVVVVPARTMRREGSVGAADRARVLLGDPENHDGPSAR